MCHQIRFEGSELSWQLSSVRPSASILWVSVRWRYQSHVNLEIAYDNLEFQVVVAEISRLGRSQDVVQQLFLEIWQMTSKNNREPLLAAESKIGYRFHDPGSYVYHFVAICEFKLQLSSGKAEIRAKWSTFRPVWPWNLTDAFEKL